MKQKVFIFIAFVTIIALVSRFLRQRVMPAKIPETKIVLPEPNAAQEKAARKVGLKRMFLVRDQQWTYVDVRVAPVRICGAGDLDAMKQEFAHEKNRRHLVTLEPLGGASGVATASLEITPEQILQGVTHRFKLPLGKKASMGIFLCKDAAKTGSCIGKPAVDINVILNHYLQDDVSADPEPADKTYFFQYVHITGDGFIEAFADVPKQTAFAELEGYVTGDSTQPDTKKSIDVAAQRTNVLRSLPVDFSQEVIIPLPMYDESTCPKMPKGK